MYCNLGKSQVIPLVHKISTPPKYFKPSQRFKSQLFSNGVFLKPSNTSEYGDMVKPRNFSSGIHGKRNFSNGVSKNDMGGENKVGGRKTLPWIASAYKNKEPKASSKAPSRSSWEVSADKYISEEGGKGQVETTDSRNRLGEMVDSRRGGSVERYENEDPDDDIVDDPRWDKIKKTYNRMADKVSGSERPARYNGMSDRGSGSERAVRYNRMSDRGSSSERPSRYNRTSDREADSERPTRYNRTQDRGSGAERVARYNGMSDRGSGSERLEARRWDDQENWGQKTWKEASESSIPSMTGEGIYGVGPVLAALSANRRDFYTLYVQQNLDLSNNNRKKKDKRGFEKILRIAEKVGLTKKELSKHDLNMITDNRPHQGLVLDASPLDLVSIRELDPLLAVEGEAAPLWVALDEVTDPQNLGAIIRSSYFFGAAGVVLCAKNSAPLSGVVSKASAGSLELMELRSCKNMMQFLSSSAENGWRVLGGSVSSKAIPLNEVPIGAPTILVMGSEGKGLRPLVERSCTDLIRIPGNIPVDISVRGDEDEEADEVGHNIGEEFRSFMAVESLNVSVAAGVLLHHLVGNNSLGSDDKQTSVAAESLSSE